MKTVSHLNYSERRNYFTRESFFTAQKLVVIVKNNDYGQITLLGHSLTDSGVIVDFGKHNAPPTGTVMNVVIKRHTGVLNKNPVPMKLIAEHPDGEFELVFLN
ncbi:MAG: hypothetical protein KAG18_00310 [Sinobacterium sp.]|nr:hypothetical protein [Sinobacterium sp.]